MPNGMPSESEEFGEYKEFFEYPDANKFHVWEDFISYYFQQTNGCQVVSHKERNRFPNSNSLQRLCFTRWL